MAGEMSVYDPNALFTDPGAGMDPAAAGPVGYSSGAPMAPASSGLADAGKGIGGGAALGATAGSIVPGVGTAVGAGVGALAGLANYFAFQKPAADRQRQLASATQRYSPWTKQWATADQGPNPLGSITGQAAAGASMGQGFDKTNMSNALGNAYLNNLNASTKAMQTGGYGSSQPGDLGLIPSGPSYGMSPWMRSYVGSAGM